MNWKGKLKARTTDRYLKPIREQMAELVPGGARVLDIGCGTGDFLRQLAPNIGGGLGLDPSPSLIAYANAQRSIHQHISFEARPADPDEAFVPPFTVVTATLFFHVLPRGEALRVLQAMGSWGRALIIAGFAAPNTAKERCLLWLDQRFSGHYRHFEAYQHQGSLAGLIAESGLQEINRYATFDSTIEIRHLRGKV